MCARLIRSSTEFFTQIRKNRLTGGAGKRTILAMDTLKVILAQQNIRQRTVAATLGVTDQDVSLWVNKKRDIPARHVKALARLLKVNLSDMLAMASKTRDGQ